MSNENDVTSDLKNLAQIAAIALIQEISKDGFQASDLLSPLKSPEFTKKLAEVAEDLARTLIASFLEKKGK